MHPYSHTHTPAQPQQPSMADVWHDYSAQPGMTAAAVQQQLHSTMQVVGMQPAPQPAVEPQLRPKPYRDPLEWLFLKHLVQVALVASVVLLVLQGSRSPVLALAYAATALLLMGVMVIADRQRFNDRDPEFEIVEFIAPEPIPAPQPVVRHAPLTPLVHQMQVALPERIDVS